jgi:TetR/AcrR family transcriptional regulator, transcriptional repressor for nem operon
MMTIIQLQPLPLQPFGNRPMRYEKGHKEATRRRIIETAAQRFRKEGIAGVGVANLMSDLGLTQGGFYNHFQSKEELAQEALAIGLERMRERLRKASNEPGVVSLAKLVDTYLNAAHRSKVDGGCMLATLAVEASRHDGPVRAQMSDGIKKMVKLVGESLRESFTPVEREAHAMAVVSCLLGTMILSRATDDPQISDRLLEAGRRAAVAVGESDAL